MPISTPIAMVEKYGGDNDHFRHVYEHLIRPAVELAGFHPISPSARGADLIHAEIIRQLIEAPLVLCDMSLLNANVFFELGVRTSLNKPICLIKDETTTVIPFDTSLVNFYSYDPLLVPWRLESQIHSIAQHIKDSHERSNGVNPIWKHFGFNVAAEIATDSGNENPLLRAVYENLRDLKVRLGSSPANPQRKSDQISSDLLASCVNAGLKPRATAVSETYIEIYFDEPLTEVELEMLRKIALRVDAEVILIENGRKSLVEY